MHPIAPDESGHLRSCVYDIPVALHPSTYKAEISFDDFEQEGLGSTFLQSTLGPMPVQEFLDRFLPTNGECYPAATCGIFDRIPPCAGTLAEIIEPLVRDHIHIYLNRTNSKDSDVRPKGPGHAQRVQTSLRF